MKKLLSLTTLLFALLVSTSFAAPQAPQLCYSATGLNISIDWTSVPGATGYTLHYAPFPYEGAHTIGSINMGTSTDVAYYLWENAHYYIAITARDSSGESGYSNIELFNLNSNSASNSITPCQESTLVGTWYLNTVETNWGQWTSELPEYVGSYLELSESIYHVVLIRNGTKDEDNSAPYTVSQNSINVSGYGESTYVISEGGTRLTIYHSDGDIEVWDKSSAETSVSGVWTGSAGGTFFGGPWQEDVVLTLQQNGSTLSGNAGYHGAISSGNISGQTIVFDTVETMHFSGTFSNNKMFLNYTNHDGALQAYVILEKAP